MMIRTLFSLLMAVQLLAHGHLPPETRTIFAMKTGVLLRMHVIAQDDTAEMQRIKQCVRQSVQDAYAAAPAEGQTMLERTRELLPTLTEAACAAARAEGFTGQVSVSVENCCFDQRTLDGLTFPAGEYPALMIRLGSAQGHNWWGLVDPELALSCAAWQQDWRWDWSLQGFLKALLGLQDGVTAHE